MTCHPEVAHPSRALAAYLAVPAIINALILIGWAVLRPQADLLALSVPGVVLIVQWGWAGMAFCVLTGLAIGLPIAHLQRAYLRDRLRAMRRKEISPLAFENAEYVLIMTLPWLIGVIGGHLFGSLMVFRPLGGILIAVNVLWARTLIYPDQLRVYAYCKRAFAARATSPIASVAHPTAPAPQEDPAAGQAQVA